jgi:hypothetical protein
LDGSEHLYCLGHRYVSRELRVLARSSPLEASQQYPSRGCGGRCNKRALPLARGAAGKCAETVRCLLIKLPFLFRRRRRRGGRRRRPHGRSSVRRRLQKSRRTMRLHPATRFQIFIARDS